MRGEKGQIHMLLRMKGKKNMLSIKKKEKRKLKGKLTTETLR